MRVERSGNKIWTALPPEPADSSERARVQHTRLRRRVLYDQHYDDAYQRLVEDVGPSNAVLWGTVDSMTNAFAQVYGKLSILYGSPPSLTVPAGGEDVAAALDELARFRELLGRQYCDEVKQAITIRATSNVITLPVRRL